MGRTLSAVGWGVRSFEVDTVTTAKNIQASVQVYEQMWNEDYLSDPADEEVYCAKH